MTESAAGKPDEPQSKDRRSVLLKLGIALNAIAGALVAAPDRRLPALAGKRKRMREALAWVALGALDAFPEGQTRMATYRNPSTPPLGRRDRRHPLLGAAHRRRRQFQVFAVNCAHLGCPVRWFPQSGLFMCPCHGGAYYADGSARLGPAAARALPVRVQGRERPALDQRRQMPTLGNVLDEPARRGARRAPDPRASRLARRAPAASAPPSAKRRRTRCRGRTASWWYVFGSATPGRSSSSRSSPASASPSSTCPSADRGLREPARS